MKTSRIVSREPNIQIMLNSFPSKSLSKYSTVEQNVDKIKSLLVCIFAEWPLDLYHAAGLFIALHRVKMETAFPEMFEKN